MTKNENNRASDGMSGGQADCEKSARLCEQLERQPGKYLNKYVGIVRGRVVIADSDFTAVIRYLQSVDPDRSQHYVVLAGHPQPAEILNFGLA